MLFRHHQTDSKIWFSKIFYSAILLLFHKFFLKKLRIKIANYKFNIFNV